MITLPPQLETELNEIALWMFVPGSQKRIAEKAEVTEQFISQVLNKKKNPNPKFMKAARCVMAENQAMFEIPQTYMKAS